MPWWKLFLIDAYRRASWPYRALCNSRAARQGHAPIMILFYHRIADDRPTPWTCSYTMFERQMRWLQAHYEMVSLAEAQRRIRSGENHRPCVTITFDDGYAENCERALPLLVRESIPCTYFVTTRNVFSGKRFPHDAMLGHDFPPNTVEQLRYFAQAGIEIGAHTRTHPDLGLIDDRDRLRDEILGSGQDLREAIGCPVRYFAFPFGQHANLSSLAFDVAREGGYDGVCSAYGGFNFPGDEGFHLQRIHGDPDMVRLKNWVTVDPRKLRTPRFQAIATERTTETPELIEV